MTEPYPPVPELNALWEFDRALRDFYAGRLEMRPVSTDGGISSWSEDDGFCERLPCFAQGNSTGSLLAVWRRDDVEPSGWPVVAFGDEGGIGLVAADARSFLRLLGTDTDLWISPGGDDYPDDASYEFDEGIGHTPGHERYVAWLAAEHDLEPAEDPGAVVDAAVERWGDELQDWLAGYIGGFERRDAAEG